ncbi:hypothetical protein EAY36_24155, partial [Vibrio anguillarum]|nr:hypothetical protein [Vibrio anguillarum]
GLRFLNFVFSQVERRLGKEYIQEQCHKLGDITLLDFEEAAKRTKLEIVSKKRNSTGYKIFFDYLGSHKTKESIGIKCDADYEAIKKHIRRTLIKIIIRKQKNYHTLKPKTSIWLLRERH